MSDLRGRLLDVSFYQPPALMRWAEWRALGIGGVSARAGIGTAIDHTGAEHRAGAQAAGLLTGAYWAIHEGYSPALQAQLLHRETLESDRLGAWLDVERPGLAEWHVRLFIIEWRRLTARPLGIYTSAPAWHAIVGRGAREWCVDLPLWAAGYPFDRSDYDAQGNGQGQLMDPASVALRSTPPQGRTPALPDPWARRGYLIWQHTGHGRLPGYAKDLDLNVMPTLANLETTTMLTHDPARGSRIGIGQVMTGPAVDYTLALAARDTLPAAVLVHDEMGTLLELQRRAPGVVRLARRVDQAMDAGPDMDTLPSDDWLRSHAEERFRRMLAGLTDAEIRCPHYWLPWNEHRPHTLEGWLRLTRLQAISCDIAERYGVKILAFGANCGTPNPSEIRAILATGIMARLNHGGHGWALHEGLLKADWVPQDADITFGLGFDIDGETAPDAGVLFGRCAWWEHIAAEMEIELASYWVTEFYPARNHPLSQYGAAEVARRYAVADDYYGRRPHCRGVLPFAVGQGWDAEDHGFAFDAIMDHMVAVRERRNAMPETEQEMAIKRELQALAAQITAKINELPDDVPPEPPLPPNPLARLTNQGIFNLFNKAFGATYFAVLTRAVPTAVLTAMLANRTAMYAGPGIAQMTLTQAEKDKLTAAL